MRHWYRTCSSLPWFWLAVIVATLVNDPTQLKKVVGSSMESADTAWVLVGGFGMQMVVDQVIILATARKQRQWLYTTAPDVRRRERDVGVGLRSLDSRTQ